MGGGGFLAHTITLSADTRRPIKRGLPNFVTSCLTFWPQSDKRFSEIGSQGELLYSFLSELSRKIGDIKILSILMPAPIFKSIT